MKLDSDEEYFECILRKLGGGLDLLKRMKAEGKLGEEEDTGYAYHPVLERKTWD